MKSFPELHRVEKLVNYSHPLFEARMLSEVEDKGKKLPIHGFILGSKDKTLPTLGITAGVHGLEKIGSHVTLHFLECLVEQLKWDEELNHRLQKCRLACIPIVNPSGLLNNTRSNNKGVDLMRNAPIEAEETPPWFVGGHTISNKLPYFRGNPQKMEIETQAVIDFVRAELFQAEFSMSLDVHSGFGTKDRLWYPYSRTSRTFPLLKDVQNFKSLMDTSFPNHVYNIEPQSDSYIISGDLWDYLYDEHERDHKNAKFIPWCLEMGSWIWVKKNPIQLFTPFGIFNPLKPHRYKRILRRHYILLDFFMRSIQSHKNWMKA